MSQQTVLLRKIQTAVATLALATCSAVAIATQASATTTASGHQALCQVGGFGWDSVPSCTK